MPNFFDHLLVLLSNLHLKNGYVDQTLLLPVTLQTLDSTSALFLSHICTKSVTHASEQLQNGYKEKCAVPHKECRRGAHIPSLGREPVGG